MEIWGDFRAGWSGNYFIPWGWGWELTRTTVLSHSQSRTATMDATAVTACPPSLSPLWFLSATLLFLPTTLVPPHPCKVRTCRTDLMPAPLLPLSRVFPEETHSPSSFSSTCLQQPLAWLSGFLDLSPQCQGNSVKPRLASATKTIHFINCNYAPIISKGYLSKRPLTRHTADYQQTHFFFTGLVPGIGIPH